MRGAAVQQVVDPLLGTLIANRYLVRQALGAGGFGTVYMAESATSDQPVALKVLHMHLLGDRETVARFQREADAASRLRHGAMASVYDVGILADGRPFMVMEYLCGQTLADIIKGDGPVPYARALPWFIECCTALQYAHENGMLHRDIKPDNIFVMRGDNGLERAKLLDFGLAKLVQADGDAPLNALTDNGIAMGTPWYMSPEQCAAKALDARTDIYSLAYSLYEAIAGKRPFPGRTHYEAMNAHLHAKLPSLNREYCDPVVPNILDEAIQRACAKSLDERFSSAVELGEQLRKALDESATSTATRLRTELELTREVAGTAGAVEPPGRTTWRRKHAKRNSTLVFVAVVASLVALVSTAGGIVVVERAHAIAARHAKLGARPVGPSSHIPSVNLITSQSQKTEGLGARTQVPPANQR